MFYLKKNDNKKQTWELGRSLKLKYVIFAFFSFQTSILNSTKCIILLEGLANQTLTKWEITHAGFNTETKQMDLAQVTQNSASTKKKSMLNVKYL